MREPKARRARFLRAKLARAYRSRAANQQIERDRVDAAVARVMAGAYTGKGRLVVKGSNAPEPINPDDPGAHERAMKLYDDMFVALGVDPKHPQALQTIISRLAMTFLPSFKVPGPFRPETPQSRLTDRDEFFASLVTEHMERQNCRQEEAEGRAYDDVRFKSQFVIDGAPMLNSMRQAIYRNASIDVNRNYKRPEIPNNISTEHIKAVTIYESALYDFMTVSNL